jgi:hypothetical protein
MTNAGVGLACGFAEDPGSHAAPVLNYGGFDRVDEHGIQFGGEVHEEGFIDTETLDAVGGNITMAGEMLMGSSDDGGETAEEEAAGFQHAPEIMQHGVEVSVVSAEVEDGAAEDEVEGGVGIGDGLDGFDAEVFGREMGSKGGCEGSGLGDGVGVLVGREDFVAFAEEIDEVASRTAAGVQDTHAGVDVAAEQLVEEIDIDVAKLFLEGEHGSCE